MVKHELEVIPLTAGGYQAHCACGWASDPDPSLAAATRAHQTHRHEQEIT